MSGGVDGTEYTAASSQRLLVSRCYFAERWGLWPRGKEKAANW